MSDRLKAILFVVGIMLLFYTVVPYLVGGGVATFLGPFKAIKYADAIQGRITGVEIERQYHTHYLDNDTEHKYSFNAFDQPLTSAQQHLSAGDKIDLNLGQQLEVGDYVTKQANSTVITVQRGDSTSRWFCSTPAEIEQAQKAAR
ncbi:hypothetical protein GCM10027422_36400 [Hymenobacter arcticus]